MFLTKHRKRTSHITIQDWPAWQRTGAIFIGMILVMVGGSVLFYHAQYQSLRQETEANLETIAQLKVDQIVQWRNERLIDALQLIKNEVLEEMLENRTPYPSIMAGLFKYHPYQNVILVTPDGQVQVSMKGSRDPLSSEVSKGLSTALLERRPIIAYQHTDWHDHKPYMYVIAPLITKNDKVLGALILECDTHTFLNPLLSAWPIKSSSAETLLVQREGDSVIFLNELRDRPGSAPKLQLPITRLELPAVQAVLGKKGTIYGKDYRHNSVIAVSKSIPDSPWFIVTKVDETEAFAPWHFRAGLILASIFGVILITNAILRVAWLRQTKFSHYTRSLIEASLDPLVTINSSGKITDLNAATETVTGLTRTELIGSDFSDYFTSPEKARTAYEQVFSEGLLRDYPLELRHRDGRITPVLYNATVYRNQSGKIAGVFAAARDISERTRTEEKIRYLASIVETSDDAIIGKTLDEQILSWNKGAERIYGYTAKEAIGRSIVFLAPPERKDELKTIIERIKRGESIEHFETTRQRKDGQIIQVMLTISPIKNANEEIVGASTIARDITVNKQAEREIKKLNQYMRSLIEASLDPLVTISPLGKITDVNVSTETATGQTRCELIGSDFTDYFTAPEKAQAAYEQVFREGSVRDYPLELRHRNGNVIPVLYNASVYRNESNEVVGVFAAARDMSEIKHAQMLLNESETRLNFAMQKSHIGVWELDLVNHTTWRTLNHDQIFGYETLLSNWTYEMFLDHVLPEDRPEVERSFRVSMDTRSDWNFECRIRRADGEVRWIFASGGHTLNSKNNLMRMSGIVFDITYSAAHDLRTPLRSIDGFSQILMEDYGHKLDPAGKKYLEIIRTDSQRMGQLIDDILHLSKISRSSLKLLPINLSDTVAEIGASFKCTEPERHVDLIIQQDCKAVADLNLMRIAMENILSNAWKFTNKQRNPKIEFGIELHEDHPVYFVRDNGIGFDMQYSSKLFGAFQRLHPIHEFPGNGIGLATVQRIIQRHGGKIWIEGRLNEGATVYFTLPQTEPIS